MVVVLHVLPEKNQRKYLQFFMGIVLMILVMSPLLSALGLDRQLDKTYARQTYDRELQEFLEGRRLLRKSISGTWRKSFMKPGMRRKA